MKAGGRPGASQLTPAAVFRTSIRALFSPTTSLWSAFSLLLLLLLPPPPPHRAFVYSALSNPELMRPSDITCPWSNQAGRRTERRLRPSGSFSPNLSCLISLMMDFKSNGRTEKFRRADASASEGTRTNTRGQRQARKVCRWCVPEHRRTSRRV